MPLYAWKCPKCGHRFEVLCSIEKSKEAVCEKCGEKAVRDYTGTCSFGAKGAGACGGNCSCGTVSSTAANDAALIAEITKKVLASLS